MTDSGGTSTGDSRRQWLDDAEDALDRAGEALRTAWEESREERLSALESAKQAARQLAAAIDAGIAGARKRLSQEGADASDVELDSDG